MIFVFWIMMLALIVVIGYTGIELCRRLTTIANWVYAIYDSFEDEDRMKLLDSVIEDLKRISKNPKVPSISDDLAPAYEAGLKDGAAELASYILSELKEEE